VLFMCFDGGRVSEYSLTDQIMHVVFRQHVQITKPMQRCSQISVNY
jgi:hypothetical protein